MAVFLIITALTGSLLAFKKEIDEALGARPSRHIPVEDRPLLGACDLLECAQRLEPRAEFGILPVAVEPGMAFEIPVFGKLDPAMGKPFVMGYESLQLNPYSGGLIRRAAGPSHGHGPLWPVTRHNLMNVVYALHKRLALPGRIGILILGWVAVAWTVDCFIGCYLTWPARSAGAPASPPKSRLRNPWFRRWFSAWTFDWRGRPYRINFKAHLALGLWTWAMLFVFAWSSVNFQLGPQVYQPVMKRFGMRPFLEEFYAMPDLPGPQPPGLTWRQALATGERLAGERAREEGFGRVKALQLEYDKYSGNFVYWLASSRSPARDKVGTLVVFDGTSGKLWKVFHLTGQDAGTTVTTWLTWMHVAMIGGLPFKILVSLMGLVITVLTMTGVYLWWKKRRSRQVVAAAIAGRASALVARGGKGPDSPQDGLLHG